MDTTISKGMKRLILVVCLSSIVVFSALVVKTRWDYEASCVRYDVVERKDPYASETMFGLDGSSSGYGRRKTAIEMFWDEDLIHLTCGTSRYRENVVRYEDGYGNERVDIYKHYNSTAPSYGTIVSHHLMILLKYLMIFMVVIVFPLMAVVWVKKGLVKG